jgi:aerobic carbon-monoxide dehydrogenase large subunit
VHGDIAHGVVGQALIEPVYQCHAERLLTSSFMDYPTPRAGDLPSFDTGCIETSAPNNPFLVEGGSESGMIDAPAAIATAVIDASCYPRRPRYLACHHCGNGAAHTISGPRRR